MIASAPATEREALTFFLAAQRASVLAIVDGLAEDQLIRTIVPSGWTLAGMIEHLGDAERVWFRYVVAGEPADHDDNQPADHDDNQLADHDDNQPADHDDNQPADIERAEATVSNGSRPGRTVAEALSYYRAQTARSDEILAATPLDARPAVRPVVDIGIAGDVMTVRDVVLHVIEETARHAGHLDVARELIDGRTGLGPR